MKPSKKELLEEIERLRNDNANLREEIYSLTCRRTPAYYKRICGDEHLYGDYLYINDEGMAFKMIFDILSRTECSIKEEDGKLIIYKEKSKIDKDYDIYVEENLSDD